MGAASSVTQTGNNSADVTLNRGHGKIVMAAALNAGVGAHFRLLNSLITSDSIVVLHVETGTATGNGARNTVTTNLSSISAGSCNIQIFNDDGNNTWAPPIVHFLVLN